MFKKIFAAAMTGLFLLSGFDFSGISAYAVSHARVSVHDPSVVKDVQTNKYYVFGSHIEAARSNDLINWQSFANGYTTPNNVEFGNLSSNLKKAFDWSGENLEDCEGGFAVWAPDVVWNPDYANSDGSTGAYMMYFCTSSTYIRSVIGYAVSKNIEGPYTFVDTLIYSGFTDNDQYVRSSTKNVNKKYTSTNIDELMASGEVAFNNSWFSNNNFNNQLFPNAIDPNIYFDTDGRMYMSYGSWSGGIFSLEIDKKTGKCIHPKSGNTADGRMIDSYFGTKISGGYGKSGEGPFIEYNPDTGYYYLWVTYGGLTAQGGYNMRVFRSQSPLGPFKDAAGNNAVLSANSNLDSVGLKVMGNYKFSTLDTAYMAGGHNSVLHDDDGKWYLVYHTRFNGGTEYHEVRVHSMQFTTDGWCVVSPFEYSGDIIDTTGYESADIAGTYEFVNHGNDTDKTIHSSSNITLSADGKISGAVSGTWRELPDSADAVLNIGGQEYHGKFLAAQNEKGTKVMSFTAVGSNNQTIWGSKTTAFSGNARSPLSIWNGADGSKFRLKNVNSGLYMTAVSTDSGANVEQSENGTVWTFRDAGDGYYSIYTDNETLLDVTSKKTANGTNIALYTLTGGDNQKYQLTENPDGSVKIRTKITNGSSCVEVVDGKTESGANIQEWEVNGFNCQDWIMEEVIPEPQKIIGDINADGELSIADLVMMQSYLLGNGSITDAEAADLCSDGVIDVFDLMILRSLF